MPKHQTIYRPNPFLKLFYILFGKKEVTTEPFEDVTLTTTAYIYKDIRYVHHTEVYV